MKLKPQTCRKQPFLPNDPLKETTENMTEMPTDMSHVETGLVVQDIWYDAPELRHLVELGKDAKPNETKNEPNYEDWGEEHAKLDYVGLIAYTVAAINELREMVDELENA